MTASNLPARDDLVDRLAVADIGFGEIECGLALQPFEVLVGARARKIVEDGDAPIAFAEIVGCIAADKARAAGDQYALSGHALRVATDISFGCSRTTAIAGCRIRNERVPKQLEQIIAQGWPDFHSAAIEQPAAYLCDTGP